MSRYGITNRVASIPLPSPASGSLDRSASAVVGAIATT
jgi:hypothetical protein